MPPGWAPVDATGSLLYTVAAISEVYGTKACPVSYYCPGNASVLSSAGWPQACPGGTETLLTGSLSVTSCGEFSKLCTTVLLAFKQ